ncbi:MAG: hypothetical protein NT148_01895 [Candidatus Nealsonbacteria bacterium]|nr:hypothetical protein [Candidatus Nealsonbacteria bacterium]
MRPEGQPDKPFEAKLDADKPPKNQDDTWDSVKEKYNGWDIIGLCLLGENENLAREIGLFPEVQEMAANRMVEEIIKADKPNLFNASKIKELFNPSDELIQKIVRERIIKDIKLLYIHEPLKIKHLLPADIFQQAAGEALVEILRETDSKDKGHIDDYASRLSVAAINVLGISDSALQSPNIQQAVKDRIIKHLNNNGTETALSLAKSFNLSKKLLEDLSIQQAAKDLVTTALISFDEEKAIKIKDTFYLKDFQSPEIEIAAEKIITHRLSSGDIDKVLKFKQKFNIADTVVQKATEAGIAKRLENNLQTAESDIQKIVKVFPVPIETIERIVKIKLFEHLQKGSVDNFLVLRNDFMVNVASDEMLKQLPDLEKLYSVLKQVIPDVALQIEKSPDLLLGIIPFVHNQDFFISSLRENPFLIEAVQANLRFGSRLAVKFPEFDELSQNNIRSQFAFKKEILAEHPGMDPESLEFRQAMQEKLKTHGRNAEIMEAAEEKGINAEQWLNYEDTRYFKLESGDSVLAFSETIATPINRIKETIDSYAHAIKEVLKQHRQELSVFEIALENPKEIEDKIAEMTALKESASLEGNTKKSEGIQKGIDNLIQKKSTLKKGKLWDKLLSDIASFQRLKDDVFNAHDDLTKSEGELTRVAGEKSASGKLIQEIKKKISSAKESLRSKLEILERRIENFRTTLPDVLSPALGKDRTEAITQEINMRVAEQFSHYDADLIYIRVIIRRAVFALTAHIWERNQLFLTIIPILACK